MDLIESESTLLYNRLQELAGPEVDDDDPDDVDYAPPSDRLVEVESEQGQQTLSSESTEHPRRDGLRSARPDRIAGAARITEAIMSSDSDEVSEVLVISDDDD